jgi:D-beta-D-heptose 7-phosphate kinase/D-beta-D-heptose 1-phosphate adenosyltransferase
MVMKKVFVNGTFDILHLGHMELISTASNSGDYLMLAIDSDRRVSEKKGPQRPIHDQNS